MTFEFRAVAASRTNNQLATVGEAELFEFMEAKLCDGSGLLIDARTNSWHRKGAIPGSVNYPFTLFTVEKDDAELIAALEQLGAKARAETGALERLLEDWGWGDAGEETEVWDFTEAKDLVLWCNRPPCGQSPRAIRGLLDVGSPEDNIKYYRGGMQMWQLWGLATIMPN